MDKEKLLDWLKKPIAHDSEYEDGYRDAFLDVIEKIESGEFDYETL